MSSRMVRGSILNSLRHILQSCDQISEYLDGIGLEEYLSTPMRKDAVERQLQILTEAAYRLGDEAPVLCPTVDWRSIRGLGNFLRHEYDKVTPQIIWKKLHEDLPPLEAAVQRALAIAEAQEPDP